VSSCPCGRAGDCPFYHAYLAHTANRNDTNEFRYVCVTIYVDAELTGPPPCTDDLGLTVGSPLPDQESLGCPGSRRQEPPRSRVR